MLRTYAQALDHSFKVKDRGRPTIKPRKTTLPSLQYTVRGFSIREGRLRLPKGVTIPVVWSRELPSEPTSVQVYQDSLRHWYASFVVRRDVEPAPEASGVIGVDWGVTTTATTTDPAFEDFRPRFLTRSTMARKAADAAIGTTKRELIERAVRAGRTVVMVAPAYTTMTCSSCFARAKQRLGLAERTFRCPDCGHTADRDRNAARTILAVAERGHTSVDDVRHGLASPSGVADLVQSELEIPRF